MLAVYATALDAHRGRFYAEPPPSERSEFQRDRDRVVHSTAFRRLAGKTQVLVQAAGDHHRNRLTHTLDVALVSRTLARRLQVNEDLAEALALAHDLGHPPFGHAGEARLQELNAAAGGFDHNEYSLKLVLEIEQRYVAFDGLNLTRATLLGMVQHNWDKVRTAFAARPYVAALLARLDETVATPPAVESQIASIADDMAYFCHDIDDALRTGLISPQDLLAVDILREQVRRWQTIEPQRLAHELSRYLMGVMQDSVVTATRVRLAAAKASAGATVVFTETVFAQLRQLRQFLSERFWLHPALLARTALGQQVISVLYEQLLASPSHLPAFWQRRCQQLPLTTVVVEYIAGMTDTFALTMYRQLTGTEPPL